MNALFALILALVTAAVPRDPRCRVRPPAPTPPGFDARPPVFDAPDDIIHAIRRMHRYRAIQREIAAALRPGASAPPHTPRAADLYIADPASLHDWRADELR
jgi:hypothetical protein